MKWISRIAALAAAVFSLFSCNNGGKALLPNASGKAGEVIVVLDKIPWEGNLGNEVRALLARDCEFLPQREPLYSLVNLSPNAFTDMFKYHRNILIFNIDDDIEKEGVIYRSNVWSQPQCIIQLNASCVDSASVVLARNGDNIAAAIEQAERNRVIGATLKFEEPKVAKAVSEMIGGKVHCPSGYSVKKRTSDFLWIAYETTYTIQGVFVYKYPVTDPEPFTVDKLVGKRNEVLKANVPGMFDNTYMTTADYVRPEMKFLSYHDHHFAQLRGFWEVEGDFMGGPFVSHSFYSKDGRDIIVLEGWVYAPKYDKRQYLRQVESFLYSFEWDKDEDTAGAGEDEGKK